MTRVPNSVRSGQIGAVALLAVLVAAQFGFWMPRVVYAPDWPAVPNGPDQPRPPRRISGLPSAQGLQPTPAPTTTPEAECELAMDSHLAALEADELGYAASWWGSSQAWLHELRAIRDGVGQLQESTRLYVYATPSDCHAEYEALYSRRGYLVAYTLSRTNDPARPFKIISVSRTALPGATPVSAGDSDDDTPRRSQRMHP